MRTVRTVADLRALLAPERRAGRRIALVPTMGALHGGHTSLIEAAARTTDLVVVSLFVNPAQFNDAGDLDAYPRTEAQDATAAQAAGAHVLFAPDAAEVYPAGFATTVAVRGPLTESLEGAHRGSAHFDGVTTVVTKLFGMVGPDVAFFGRKDAQQAQVIRALVRDLNLPVRIELCPTVREADGLALSSRNARLDGPGRENALALSRALGEVADGIARGHLRTGAAAGEAGLSALRRHGAQPEYFCAVDPASMVPAETLDGDVLLVCAANVAGVRLIDNLPITSHHLDAEAVTLIDRASTVAN